MEDMHTLACDRHRFAMVMENRRLPFSKMVMRVGLIPALYCSSIMRCQGAGSRGGI